MQSRSRRNRGRAALALVRGNNPRVRIVCTSDSNRAGRTVVCSLVLWCLAAAPLLQPPAPTGATLGDVALDTIPVVVLPSVSPAVAASVESASTVDDTAGTLATEQAGPVALRGLVSAFPQDTVRRQRAVVLSDWYTRRLTIHRYGSYVMLPLFAAEVVLGSQLLAQKDGVYDGTRRVPIDANLRNNHRTVATGVAALFVVNTTTGLWNLWDARGDGSHSTRRTVHVLTMLGANAGFALTGVMGGRATQHRPSDARAHRNVALTSMALATTGVALMWF